jgi:integrase
VKSASDDLVFVNAKGGPVSYSNLYHRHYRPLFDSTEDRPRLAHIKFHRLRHFAVSTWIESGFPPKKIMSFAGHSSITVTFDTYGHLFPDPENDQAAFEEIEAGVLGL